MYLSSNNYLFDQLGRDLRTAQCIEMIYIPSHTIAIYVFIVIFGYLSIPIIVPDFDSLISIFNQLYYLYIYILLIMDR